MRLVIDVEFPARILFHIYTGMYLFLKRVHAIFVVYVDQRARSQRLAKA